MCFGEIGSEFYCAFADATVSVSTFDSHIKSCHSQQTFWIVAKLRLNVLRGFERSFAFTAQIEVHRNLRDDTGKQFFGNADVCFVDRAQQLFDTADGVAVFQLLIAKRGMCADQ